ncbi:hypothetical protein QTN47_21140 [Danxiaibacter flavus]|uniref:Uncharacterized protein n=1 Tax=Danxiaibacter flavus TaxID=3049108 RepID=A0ABV3ZJN5_9BACT|nr:hypothetical protein QNM32_21145 [Chitinophagaceae bacterium DXS]
MLSKNDLEKVYSTILCSPGMNESVKVLLQLPRKNILCLVNAIEHSLLDGDKDKRGFDMDVEQTLKAVSIELLEKSGLKEMYDHLAKLA